MQDAIAELKRAAAAYAEAVTVAEERRVKRDAVIAAAFGEGVPIRVIGSAVGLTPSRVSDILGRPMGRRGRPSHNRRAAGDATRRTKLTSQS